MNMKRRKFLGIMAGTSVIVSLVSVLGHGIKSRAQQLSGALAERFQRMSQEVAVDTLGDEWKGYVLRIMGGNDKQGFPSVFISHQYWKRPN